MEKKSPQWGDGKTLIGLWQHPDPGSLILPLDYSEETTDPQSLKALEEETEE